MWSGAGLVFFVLLNIWPRAAKATSSRTYELPVSSNAPNLRLRAELGPHHDRVLISEDRGRRWSTVFSGRLDRVQLPILRQDFVQLNRTPVLPKGREDVFFDFADFEVNPERWWFAFLSRGRTIIAMREGTIVAPDVGRISKVHLGEHGRNDSHTFHIVAVWGSFGRGTYLYLDDHKPLRLSEQFIEEPLEAFIEGGVLNFGNVNLAYRAGVGPVVLDPQGFDRYESQLKTADQVRELLLSAQNLDWFRSERLYREILDSHLIMHGYLKDRGRADNAQILNVARDIWRQRLCSNNERLCELSVDPRYRRDFYFLIVDLSRAWLDGVIQFRPTLRMARAKLAGRLEDRASLCVSDLENFTAKSPVTQRALREKLDYLALALRTSW